MFLRESSDRFIEQPESVKNIFGIEVLYFCLIFHFFFEALHYYYNSKRRQTTNSYIKVGYFIY